MIPVCEPILRGNELKYVTDCIKSNWISSKGRYVDLFEKKFSEACKASYGVSTMNGTAALHLALATLGVGKNDEVIMPALTMVATAYSAYYTGAKAVFVDSDRKTFNMDPKKIEERITKKTKVIMPVHLYGHPCDMDPILKIAKSHNLYVVEDAAESHGALYKGKIIGGLSDMTCFSFYSNKIITTGEGGMITTNNKEFAEKASMLKDMAFIKERRFLHPCVGFNYRMTNLQAAVGLAQVEYMDELVEKRVKNAQLYNSLLKGTKGITLPPNEPWAKNVYWMYSIIIEDNFGISREELQKELAKKGIETRPFFVPMHMQPFYGELYKGESFPVAEDLSEKGINLPSGPTLTKEQITTVVEAIKSLQR